MPIACCLYVNSGDARFTDFCRGLRLDGGYRETTNKLRVQRMDDTMLLQPLIRVQGAGE
jgi:hypothetical protein